MITVTIFIHETNTVPFDRAVEHLTQVEGEDHIKITGIFPNKGGVSYKVSVHDPTTLFFLGILFSSIEQSLKDKEVREILKIFLK